MQASSSLYRLDRCFVYFASGGYVCAKKIFEVFKRLLFDGACYKFFIEFDGWNCSYSCVAIARTGLGEKLGDRSEYAHQIAHLYNALLVQMLFFLFDILFGAITKGPAGWQGLL